MHRPGTALVTGGARRIGSAIVKDLTANGYDVAIHYTSSERTAHELADSLSSPKVRTVAIEADLTERAGCEALFSEAVEALGPVDLLVNNASIFESDSAAAIDDALWDAHFAIHAKAPALLGSLMAQEEPLDNGLIVNIIDQRVLRPNPNFFSYSLSKATLYHATKLMALSHAPRVRVNAIGPGPTLPGPRQVPEDFQRQIDGLILKRGPALDEFGRTIRYLHETPSITGQMIALDGGQHLAWETPDIAGIPE